MDPGWPFFRPSTRSSYFTGLPRNAERMFGYFTEFEAARV